MAKKELENSNIVSMTHPGYLNNLNLQKEVMAMGSPSQHVIAGYEDINTGDYVFVGNAADILYAADKSSAARMLNATDIQKDSIYRIPMREKEGERLFDSLSPKLTRQGYRIGVIGSERVKEILSMPMNLQNKVNLQEKEETPSLFTSAVQLDLFSGMRVEQKPKRERKMEQEGFDPTKISLRKLEEGEHCYVERRYTETGYFSFTGTDHIESDSDVAYIFRALEDKSVENSFICMVKDGKPTVFHLGIGSATEVMAPIENTLPAFQELQPEKVWFIHNHPSGNLKVSKDDFNLQKRMEEVFGEACQPGIIINTTSGKFMTYNSQYEYGGDFRVREGKHGKKSVKTYAFDKTVFSKDWNPETAFKALSYYSVAGFVSSHRLGEHEKLNLIIVDNHFAVTGNVFLPWTDIAQVCDKEHTDAIARTVLQIGGKGCYIYGSDDAIRNKEVKAMNILQDRLKQFGVKLVDVMSVKRSLYDEGVIKNQKSERSIAHDDSVRPRRLTPQQRETGGALVDQLQRMGIKVHTDLKENRRALKEAQKDQSQAGKIRYMKSSTGENYGWVYKGEMRLDLRKLDGELALHEYAHLWCEAMRRVNPQNWAAVVNTVTKEPDTMAFVKRQNPHISNVDDLVEEAIASYSGKKGADRLQEELQRMTPRDSNYNSRWNNIFQNISKAIQDFWQHVGDSMNIRYQSKDDIADMILKDFAEKVNPVAKVEKWLESRDKIYEESVENDIDIAVSIFEEALQENIGNGITPFVAAGGYRGEMQSLAHRLKDESDTEAVNQAAEKIIPVLPDVYAALVPAPGHEGYATHTLRLANKISELTGLPVVDALRGEPRESQYDHKKATGKPLNAEELCIFKVADIPHPYMPIVIDNVVHTGNTAEACVKALGGGIVVSLASAVSQERHVASLKSANPIVYDKEGNLIPLSQRFELKNGYIGKKKQSQEPVEEKEIAGLKGYSEQDVLKYVREHFESMLEGTGIDAEIVDMKVIGSRVNGNSDSHSDLDVLLEFKGDASEDSLFNILNDEEEGRLYIEGIPVDINPITEGKSGTIQEWLERNVGYNKETDKILNINSNMEKSDSLENKVLDRLDAAIPENGQQLQILRRKENIFDPRQHESAGFVKNEYGRYHVYLENQDMYMDTVLNEKDKDLINEIYQAALLEKISKAIGEGYENRISDLQTSRYSGDGISVYKENDALIMTGAYYENNGERKAVHDTLSVPVSVLETVLGQLPNRIREQELSKEVMALDKNIVLKLSSPIEIPSNEGATRTFEYAAVYNANRLMLFENEQQARNQSFPFSFRELPEDAREKAFAAVQTSLNKLNSKSDNINTVNNMENSENNKLSSSLEQLKDMIKETGKKWGENINLPPTEISVNGEKCTVNSISFTFSENKPVLMSDSYQGNATHQYLKSIGDFQQYNNEMRAKYGDTIPAQWPWTKEEQKTFGELRDQSSRYYDDLRVLKQEIRHNPHSAIVTVENGHLNHNIDKILTDNESVEQLKNAVAKAEMIKTLQDARTEIGEYVEVKPTNIKLADTDVTIGGVAFTPFTNEPVLVAAQDLSALGIEEKGTTEYAADKILNDIDSIQNITKAIEDRLQLVSAYEKANLLDTPLLLKKPVEHAYQNAEGNTVSEKLNVFTVDNGTIMLYNGIGDARSRFNPTSLPALPPEDQIGVYKEIEGNMQASVDYNIVTDIVSVKAENGEEESYKRIYGWTHDDPALIYNNTETEVFFYDKTKNTVENIENPAGIDTYENRQGFFLVRADEYEQAYADLEKHDREQGFSTISENDVRTLVSGEGLEYSALSLQQAVEAEGKSFSYAMVTNGNISLYERQYDAYDNRNETLMSELTEDKQQEILWAIHDRYSEPEKQVTVYIDSLQIPDYALPAIIDGDYSGINDPEDTKNIEQFLNNDLYKGVIFSPREEEPSFHAVPAFGLPADTVTVDVLRISTIQELRDNEQIHRGINSGEMVVFDEHLARVKDALQSIKQEGGLLTHELNGIFSDANRMNPSQVRDYFRQLFTAITEKNNDALKQEWNKLSELSGGSLRQMAWVFAYKLSDSQIQTVTFDETLKDNNKVQQSVELQKNPAMDSELREAKGYLMDVIGHARAEMGDVILIPQTDIHLAGIKVPVSGLYYVQDGNGKGEYRLIDKDGSALAVQAGRFNEFGVDKIIENYHSAYVLTMAVREAQISNLVGKGNEIIFADGISVSRDEPVTLKDVVNKVKFDENGKMEIVGYRLDDEENRMDLNKAGGLELSGFDDLYASVKEYMAQNKKMDNTENIHDKVYHQLDKILPQNGDRLTLKEPFVIQEADGLKEGVSMQARQIHRGINPEYEKDIFVVGDSKGGVNTHRMSAVDLERIDAVLQRKDYVLQLSEREDCPYRIHTGTDNNPGGVEGEYHVNFGQNINAVSYKEMQAVAEEMGGTMRITNGSEWGDFYHREDAEKFANRIVAMNADRIVEARETTHIGKTTVHKGKGGSLLIRAEIDGREQPSKELTREDTKAFREGNVSASRLARKYFSKEINQEHKAGLKR